MLCGITTSMSTRPSPTCRVSPSNLSHHHSLTDSEQHTPTQPKKQKQPSRFDQAAQAATKAAPAVVSGKQVSTFHSHVVLCHTATDARLGRFHDHRFYGLEVLG